MTLSNLVKLGETRLKQANIEDYAYDNRVLLEELLGVSKTDILLNPNREVDEKPFLDAIAKREEGIPLQYIIGHWEFMGLDFQVNENVLIPRADTETVVEYIIKNATPNIKILDMCCGSGCIGLSLKHFLNVDVTLCDISDKALDVAENNAKALSLDVKIEKADLTFGYLPYFADNTFDIIVSNPPYIKSCDMQNLSKEVKNEPSIALDGGTDGTDFYKKLITEWKDALKPNGEMVLETGYDTANSVISLFEQNGYHDIQIRRDLGGIIRSVGAKRGR